MVAVGILQGDEGAPGHFLGRGAEIDAALQEFLVSFFDVFAPEREMRKSTDVAFVFFGSEEDDPGFRAGNSQLDPALLAEGLVGEDVEAELFGVEGQGAVQAALRILLRRQLVRAHHASRTAVPECFVLRPWAR